jgi:hypothetical protein
MAESGRCLGVFDRDAMPTLPKLPAVFLPAILCTVAATAPAASQPAQDVEALVACTKSQDFAASHDCATALTELSTRNPSVGADGRVHRALAVRIHRDIEEFREWRRIVTTKTDAELERDSPEYEDGASTMRLVSAIQELVPHAGPETQPVLFDALLEAVAMSDGLDRSIAHYGQPAFGATLNCVRSASLERQATGYDVLGLMLEAHAAGSLAAPLSARDRQAAAHVITAGLQAAESSLRITAIRAARRGRVEGALPILRVLAATEPKDGPDSIGQAAADAVASLSR